MEIYCEQLKKNILKKGCFYKEGQQTKGCEFCSDKPLIKKTKQKKRYQDTASTAFSRTCLMAWSKGVEGYAAEVKSPRAFNTWLFLLTQEYKKVLETEGPERADFVFLDMACRLRDEGKFTNDEVELLSNAAIAKNLQAIQTIVKAEPETIHLRFVAEVLVDVLRNYKIGTGEKARSAAKEWQGFLDSTLKGKKLDKSPLYQLTEEDKDCLVELAKRKDPSKPASILQAELSLEPRRQREIIPIKKGPGRLKMAR